MSKVESFPPVRIPSIQLSHRTVRFLVMTKNGQLLTPESIKSKHEGTPLFLGTDILDSTNNPTHAKNGARIHLKYAKKGLATKLSLKDFRVDGINSCKSLWVYNIQGVFQVVFTLYEREMQRDCLLKLKDEWIKHYDTPKLKEDMIIECSSSSGFLNSFSAQSMVSLSVEIGQNPNQFQSNIDESTSQTTNTADRADSVMIHDKVTQERADDANCIDYKEDGNVVPTKNIKRNSLAEEIECESAFDEVEKEIDFMDDCVTEDKNTGICGRKSETCRQGTVLSEAGQTVTINNSDATVDAKRLGEILSHGLTDLSDNELEGSKGMISVPLDLIKQKKVVIIFNHSSNSNTEEKPDKDTFNDTAISTRMEMSSSGFLTTQQHCQCKDCLECIVDIITSYLLNYSSKQKSVIQDLVFLMIHLLRVELESDYEGVDFNIFKFYLREVEMAVSLKDLFDDFQLYWKKSQFLLILCQYVGKVFHDMQTLIAEKVKVFKQENIMHLDTLPSAEVIISDIFPDFMKVLVSTWMGERSVFSDVASCHLEDHTYWSKESEVKSSAPDKNLVLLILELLNKALISPLSHLTLLRVC